MEPKKAGRPKGSKNKPKPRIEMIPTTRAILTNPAYKHLRAEVLAGFSDINRPLQAEAVVEVQPNATARFNKRSSTERKQRKSEKFLSGRSELASRIRRAQAVAGPCHIQGCLLPSKFISRSGPRYTRFCDEHAAANVDKYPDLVGKYGIPFLNHPGADRVLFIDRNSWRFVERDGESFKRDLDWYIPFTPTRASAYIHFEMMDYAFNLASNGISADKIWELLTGNFVAPLPLELESQFLDLLHES